MSMDNKVMNDYLPFYEKTALITGSGRGIGRTIAIHLANLGANVIINYFRNPKPAHETLELVESLGRRALLVKANIGEMDELEHLFAITEKEFGGLDIFIHNAASGYNRRVLEQRPKGWEWTMNINARSFLFAAQLAARLMEPRGGGHIVSISSPGANYVLPDYAIVGASKAAIEAITRYLAVELAPLNIAVNAVSPGIVETEALKHFKSMSRDNTIKKIVDKTPAGRLTTPEDVAGVVAFLCSPPAAMIRGQVILVDGGYLLAPH